MKFVFNNDSGAVDCIKEQHILVHKGKGILDGLWIIDEVDKNGRRELLAFDSDMENAINAGKEYARLNK